MKLKTRFFTNYSDAYKALTIIPTISIRIQDGRKYSISILFTWLFWSIIFEYVIKSVYYEK